MKVFATFNCEDCGERFQANIHEKPAVCGKCSDVHLYCPACAEVHALSAAVMDHYLATLLAQFEN